MIVLSKTLIRNLEKIIEPGFTVELTVMDGELKVSRRPTDQDEIPITPTLVSADERVEARLVVQKTGEDQVDIARVVVEAGDYITGIKISRKKE